jgi:ADP-ribose pyrophosphatase YjhB (NUDIX family)
VFEIQRLPGGLVSNAEQLESGAYERLQEKYENMKITKIYRK